MAVQMRNREILQNVMWELKKNIMMPAKRELTGDSRYLFISLGGLGADTLYTVRYYFEKNIAEDQLNERVRFLAIDSDPCTNRKTEEIILQDGTERVVETGVLSDTQFFLLNSNSARAIVNAPVLDANVASWISPEVIRRIREDGSCLDGSGSGGMRQLGRLSLYPAVTAAGLSERITKLAGELIAGNANNLNVVILAGIGGGLGSGALVDLTYLVRDCVSAHFQNNANYCGFVLLPTMGRGKSQHEIERGNCNGYAALKEINHFMTLDQRGDTYSFTYGNGRRVVSGEPLFDTCYLIDGQSCPGPYMMQALAESLLTLASSEGNVGGVTVPTYGRFSENTGLFAQILVANKPAPLAAREADYVYSALSFGEIAIPIHEMKVYAGKLLFDKIYAQFQKCADVGALDAGELVKRMIGRGVKTKDMVKKTVDAEINQMFTDLAFGPFYTKNLLKEVGAEVDRLKAKARLFRPGMVTEESLDWIKAYCTQCYEETFGIYAYVIGAMRNELKEHYGCVVHASRGETEYSFVPQGLSDGAGSKGLVRYLESLVEPGVLRRLSKNLLQNMLQNKENWLSSFQIKPGGKQDAPAAICRFWNEELDSLIHPSLEDLLIKQCSGDPWASYSPEMDHLLQRVAENLLKRLVDPHRQAKPMVRLTNGGLTADDFVYCTCLTVPEPSPHLYAAFRRAIDAGYAGTVKVELCKGKAVDRISCCKRFSGLPAFKLEWTKNAEMAYERYLSMSAGLHMSETAGGKQWKDAPNLLPQSVWDGWYSNLREMVMVRKATELFDNARAMGLAAGGNWAGNVQVYTVHTLPEEFLPPEELYQALARTYSGSGEETRLRGRLDEAEKRCADALYGMVGNWQAGNPLLQNLQAAGVALRPVRLQLRNTVIAQHPADDSRNWDEKVACFTLRKLPETMQQLERTLPVAHHLLMKIRI